MRLLYGFCSFFLLVLGLIGLVLPLVPSSPFLIPALLCLHRAFPRATRKLLSFKPVRRLIPRKLLDRLN
ncbi:MAG: DUF454 family protein [Aquificae bacterium]|nr:DUF454 family protein [Aquificota bacterium]